ncbi:hypothetical protein H0Z60_13555 [Ectothiorhodospiraceae bacterium WFHF3C12]|nr:hypothetical protein [Ectothiorhodospiraceae bacterium WFHF3C12]
MQATLSASPIALTVELPFAEVARGARPPQPLSRADAQTLAEAVGKDLQRLLGDVLYEAGMVSVGALYDLPEVLQPGLPMVDALTSVYADAMPPTGFEPSVLAIGGQGGRFPIPDIAPRREAGAGPLLILPLLLVAPPETLDRITPILEEKLLHTGQAGLDTTRAVQSCFGLRPENLTYATFNDLCALMKVQLDHGGFGALWDLIENALFQRGNPAREILDTGNLFLWTGERVLTPFFTVGEWLSHPPPGAANVIDAYLAWLRAQRQYQAGLEAHGIDVVAVFPHPDLFEGSAASACDTAAGRALDDQQMRVETDPSTAGPGSSESTRVSAVEHATPETGPVAFSAGEESTDGSLAGVCHYYPVRRAAVTAIRRLLEERARSLGVVLNLETADEVLLDARGRQLRPRP